MQKITTSYGDIDAYFERERHRLKIPGISLAIVEGDKIVHIRRILNHE
jgi:hypothetical protein